MRMCRAASSVGWRRREAMRGVRGLLVGGPGGGRARRAVVRRWVESWGEELRLLVVVGGGVGGGGVDFGGRDWGLWVGGGGGVGVVVVLGGGIVS